MSHWYRYLLAVRSPEPTDPEQVLRTGTFDMYDGDIGPARRPRGCYRVMPAAEVAAAFPDAAWLRLDHPEPVVGPVCGFVNLEWWTDRPQVRHDDADTLLWLTRGYLVDLPSGTAFDPVVYRSWPLAEVTRRHGFGDGDFLLSRERWYLDKLRWWLTDELVEAGVTATCIRYDTHHNPLLVEQDVAAGLAGRQVDLWGYDHRLIDTPEFRRLVLAA